MWRDKILTWDNLNKRGIHGPNRCAICTREGESINHLFFSCPVIKRLWNLFCPYFMDPTWVAYDFISAIKEWDKLTGKFKSLPFFLVWEVWNGRNDLIFENRPFQIHNIYSKIMEWIEVRPISCQHIVDGSHRNKPHEIAIPAIFFDGASTDGNTGCGVWIKLSQRDRIHIYWNGGPGSKNKAEIMAL